ncbi:hypothetical protein Misp01_74190 [Microtetraspora sp. NBRC 13810]|uniref:immunity protein TriTu family protein n=1 Tax=Microtetraspora sp. NBRC 13810 TaxID=3030990 RepID=UPI0024A4EFD1|nr:hypothetical protein [Microtetraspora sp. NBRC 13810]GLW12291.1 hypothetical protein Misp01_74190 [Microtetraspora sp. NBRC 13810]
MPLEGSDLLEAASVWIANMQRGDGPSLLSEIEESPADRDPRSIRWILEGSEKMGQVILWTDGQAELDLVDAESGDVRSEHAQIEDREGMERALRIVRDWVL